MLGGPDIDGLVDGQVVWFRPLNRVLSTASWKPLCFTLYDILPSCNCLDVLSVNSILIMIVFEGHSFFFPAICSGGILHLWVFVSLDLHSVMKFNTSALQNNLFFGLGIQAAIQTFISRLVVSAYDEWASLGAHQPPIICWPEDVHPCKYITVGTGWERIQIEFDWYWATLSEVTLWVMLSKIEWCCQHY